MENVIHKVGKGEFRTSLTIGDVILEPTSIEEVFTEEGIIEVTWLYLHDSIPAPYMGYLYSADLKYKLNSVIEMAVNDMMFINPGIDAEGKEQLAGFILGKLLRYKLNREPAELLEAIRLQIAAIDMVGGATEPTIDKKLRVLYEKGSVLTPSTKRIISLQVNKAVMNRAIGELIHSGVLYALEAEHRLRYIDREVIQRNIVASTGVEMSLSKYIYSTKKTSDTNKILEIENESRPIGTDKELEAYKKFIELSDMPYSTVAKELGISKSKVSKFKKLI